MSFSNQPNIFSTKIDLSLAEKMKKELQEQGFTLSTPQYTIFSAQKKGVTCTLYASGSLVVQGKEKGAFIEFYLEPEILKSFDYTNPEINLDLTPRIGVDEAGKGDFFGPLCIASLYADEEGVKQLLSLGVKDSKNLSDASILKIAKELKQHFQYSTVYIYPEKYNELYKNFKNLNFLLGWAHSSAIFNLSTKTLCKNVTIDQFADKSIVANAVKRKNLDLNLTQRHKGENDIVVAAASILARASFLEGLEKLKGIFNLTLPKGASQKVIATGLEIALKYGKEALAKVGKLHFKTYQDILSKLELN